MTRPFLFSFSPHQRLALSFFLLLLVVMLWFGAWFSIPWGGGAWVWSKPLQGRAAQTRLAIAIQTKMKMYLPLDKERDVILKWISSGGQRDGFYHRVWPILRKNCHRCHGHFRRAKGAPSLVRFAQVEPLIRTKETIQNYLWRGLQRQFPGISTILLILSLMIGGSSLSSGEKWVWTILPFLTLVVHLVGLWIGMMTSWGLAVAAYAPIGWGVISTLLALRLLQNWWFHSESSAER